MYSYFSLAIIVSGCLACGHQQLVGVNGHAENNAKQSSKISSRETQRKRTALYNVIVYCYLIKFNRYTTI